MTNEENYVVDTSVLVERLVSKMIEKKEIKGRILIPHAAVAELENQANHGQEIGFLGLEEIQKIREEKDVEVEFVGSRPTETQIKYAKSGEIDAYIRELAYNNEATLITADMVQAESGKAFGIKVLYMKSRKYEGSLSIEKYFDEQTMSVHIKQDLEVHAKKGAPGNWSLHTVSKEKLSAEQIEELAKEIAEKTKLDSESFTEIERKYSTVVQYKNYRIVIVRPPVSDGWEITIVRPIKKVSFEEYHIPEKLKTRIEESAKGIIVCGETGSGKSTFVQAIAEDYVKRNRIVKTVESPRDLQLPDQVTQYSKNFARDSEIHDILFLSRPDNIIFDEVRDTPDFKIYTDLRLAGANVIGVLHASEPIDAVQRFISRLDTGMIPSVVDTIIFIAAGAVKKVHALRMVVKVPSGMMEADLARPVVEVSDYLNNKLEYEMYSYGEQTVVVPVSEERKKSGIKMLAEAQIEQYFKMFTSHVKAELISDNKAVVQVNEEDIPKLIGTGGRNIEQTEKALGISIEIQEFKREKGSIPFEMKEEKKHIIIFAEPGMNVDVMIDNKMVLSAFTSKKGMIKIHKSSNIGKDIVRAMAQKKNVQLRA